jgi:DNA-directed RNA polymerase specialized sigma24 family protein
VNLKLLQIARSVDRGQLDRGIEHFERYCYRVILNGIYDYNRSRREISMLSDGSRQVHHFISLDNDNQDLIDVSFEQEYESAGDIWNRAVNHLEKHVKRELYDTQLQFLNDRHLCDMSVAEMAERYNKSRASIGKQTTQAYQDLRDLLLDTDFKLEFDF